MQGIRHRFGSIQEFQTNSKLFCFISELMFIFTDAPGSPPPRTSDFCYQEPTIDNLLTLQLRHLHHSNQVRQTRLGRAPLVRPTITISGTYD